MPCSDSCRVLKTFTFNSTITPGRVDHPWSRSQVSFLRPWSHMRCVADSDMDVSALLGVRLVASWVINGLHWPTLSSLLVREWASAQQVASVSLDCCLPTPAFHWRLSLGSLIYPGTHIAGIPSQHSLERGFSWREEVETGLSLPHSSLSPQNGLLLWV